MFTFSNYIDEDSLTIQVASWIFIFLIVILCYKTLTYQTDEMKIISYVSDYEHLLDEEEKLQNSIENGNLQLQFQKKIKHRVDILFEKDD